MYENNYAKTCIVIFAGFYSVRILKYKFKLEFIPQPHDADSLLPVWGHETLQAYLVGSTAAV